jgi:hypothetical protein
VRSEDSRAEQRCTSAIILPPKRQADIDLAQSRLLRRLFVGRAAGTAIGFAPGENRDRGFVLEFPQEIVGNGLEKLAFDGALASASSSQSLENPHHFLR